MAWLVAPRGPEILDRADSLIICILLLATEYEQHDASGEAVEDLEREQPNVLPFDRASSPAGAPASCICFLFGSIVTVPNLAGVAEVNYW